MSLEYFTGDHLPALLSRIRATLGPEACVVQLKRNGRNFELIASDGTGSYSPEAVPLPATPDAPDFREILKTEVVRDVQVAPKSESPAPSRWAPPVSSASAAVAPRPSFMVRPWVVALVGPTGAGKTTTIAKLATNALGFAGSRVGLIGLDTYRVGAVEQLETYADLADLPIEIAYNDAEVGRALARLNDCEVVLVDTPGRGPRNTADTETVCNWLKQLAPDEVHLTLPAGQLPAVTRRWLRSYDAFGVTHVLATKLDEFPSETGVFAVAHEHSRRMRWITDGQEVPVDLHHAAEHLAAALRRRDGVPALESVA